MESQSHIISHKLWKFKMAANFFYSEDFRVDTLRFSFVKLCKFKKVDLRWKISWDCLKNHYEGIFGIVDSDLCVRLKKKLKIKDGSNKQQFCNFWIRWFYEKRKVTPD